MPGGEILVDGHHLGTLPEGWERSETNNGIPYYLNHGESTTQWEHPDISGAFDRMDGMNDIKYGAYRTAMKLRSVQKLTNLGAVDLELLSHAFSEFGWNGSSHNSNTLSVLELESLLNKIFQLAQRSRSRYLQPDQCVEVTLSWTLGCLDVGRTGVVKLRSLKLALAALCCSKPQDKYEYLFTEVCSERGVGISKSTLKTLLLDILLLPQNVYEGDTFKASHVDDAVSNCWNVARLQQTDTLNRDEFLDWVFKEPACLVWLPTLYRLATAETVKHEAKCSKCKTFPIIGFRYRCLKCTNVDLCQSCYWTQQTLKNHKAMHPIREYCLATTTGDDIRDFTKQLKYKITRKYRRQPPKKSYLDYPVSQRRPQDVIPETSPIFDNVHTRINLLAARLQELSGEHDPYMSPPVPPISEEECHQLYPPPPSEEEIRERQRLEGQIRTLQGEKQQLQATVETLRQQKTAKVKEIVKVCNASTATVPTISPAPVETRSVGVNTPGLPVHDNSTSVNGYNWEEPSRLSRASGGYSLLLGNEEEELQAMLRELLAAFPTQTTKTVACDMNHPLIETSLRISSSIEEMVEQVISFQGL